MPPLTWAAAYIIFSIGLIKPFMTAMHPACFKTFDTCSYDEVSAPGHGLACLGGRLLRVGRCAR